MKHKFLLALIAATGMASIIVLITSIRQANAVKDLINSNIDALTSTEVEHSGSCGGEVNDCIGECPVCHELVYVDGRRGPANSLSHNEQ